MSAEVRVALIGGGIAGVMAAWELARTGRAAVTLLEAAPTLGEHATGRSAAVLSETSGTREMCALARASRAFFESPPDGFADHPLTGPRGLLWYGRDGDEHLLDGIAAVAASGVAPTARRVVAREAQDLLPALRAEAVGAGGVWEPDARSIDVAAVVQSAARGATASGARILTSTPLVDAVLLAGAGWRIRTADTTIEVDVIVNAAGAWGDEVAQRCGVEPIGLQPMRRTACIVPVSVDVSAWPLCMDAAGRCYFEPETGGLLVSPADETPSAAVDARPEEIDVAWGIEMLHEATTLQVRSVSSAWAGLRTFATHRAPVAGPDPDATGFTWLVGQGGAGIKTAPALARAIVASLGLAEWPSDLDALGLGADTLSVARVR